MLGFARGNWVRNGTYYSLELSVASHYNNKQIANYYNGLFN